MSAFIRHSVKKVFIVSFLLCSCFVITPSFSQLPVIKNGNKLESPFTKVYEKVAPSVVMITVKGDVSAKGSGANPFEFFFNPQQQQQQQQQEREFKGIGSGVIIDREGHIITNNHVVESPDKQVVTTITVKLNEKEQYDAEIVGRDPETDIAVIKLKLDGKILPASYVAELGDSDTLKPGDYAIALGNPINLERTITVGVISALGRYDLHPEGADIRFENFIQTDAQINPGNSGGALADIDGKIIGINDMYTAQFAGIGFAIPINLARKIAMELVSSGGIKRGFVGINMKDISDEIKGALELDSKEGVFVENVLANSPAEKAGIKNGDVIQSLNGQKIKDRQDFLFKIADNKPGTSVQLGVFQKGKTKTISLQLADRSAFQGTTAQSGSGEWRGIKVGDLTDEEKKYTDSGVLVVGIDAKSPASDSNLQPGDIIIEIDQQPVKDVQDFLQIKQQAKPTKPILIYRMRIQGGQVVKGYVAVKGK